MNVGHALQQHSIQKRNELYDTYPKPIYIKDVRVSARRVNTSACKLCSA